MNRGMSIRNRSISIPSGEEMDTTEVEDEVPQSTSASQCQSPYFLSPVRPKTEAAENWVHSQDSTVQGYISCTQSSSTSEGAKGDCGKSNGYALTSSFSFLTRLGDLEGGFGTDGRAAFSSNNLTPITSCSSSIGQDGDLSETRRTEFRAGLYKSWTRGTPAPVSMKTPRCSGRRPTKTPQASTTGGVVGVDVNPGCFVSVVEGRGSARGEVGVASISLSNSTLILCQFSDSRTYVRTLTKLALFNPAEILLPTTGGSLGVDSNASKLYEDVHDQCPNANVTHIHRKYYSESRGLQTVKHLCAPEYSSVELQLRHKYYALAAAFALLKYVEYIQNVVYAPNSLRVEFQASADSTMIDAETARHVELLASSYSSKSQHSLFGVMNKCSTAGGTKFLRASLFQPPVKVSLIEQRLDSVQELIGRPDVTTGIQALLGRFCDLDQLLSLCAVLPKKESLYTVEQRINQVIGLKHVLELVPGLHTSLAGDMNSELLAGIRNTLEDTRYAEMLAKVKNVIHEEAKVAKGSASMRLQRCFAVRSGINGLLDVARRTYCEIVDDIETLVRGLAENFNVPMRVGYNAQRGYHVQICGENAKRVRIKNLPDTFLHPQKWRNVISFTTEDIVKADQRSQDALREITLMSNVIVQELVSELRGSIGSLYKLSEGVNTLDVLVSMAEVSSEHGYVRPRFGDHLAVRGGRHPILEKLDRPPTVVANDMLASKEANLHVLTGPNMSGKSTYLKQLVLLQIMAQVGCFVPAIEDSNPLFRVADTIFSRVGTADSIECNASTFAMEMKETAYILGNLGTASLVVIDELGRGTSVEEGAALCWAIAERLANSSAFTFLATHFTLLSKLEKLAAGVESHSFVTEMSGQGGSLVHTHRLTQGQHDFTSVENYGLRLARLSSMPSSIVDEAEKMAQTLQSAGKVVPDAGEEDVQKLNYIRLFRMLVSAQESFEQGDSRLDVCKTLQAQFVDQDADEEDGQENMD